MTGILAVFLDDARWDALDHMPWTKSMAERRGITCTDARSNAPLCVTARLVFHSGRLDTKSGGGAVVQEDNWGVWLQAAGFRTAAIGKWHLLDMSGQPPTTGWDHVVWPTDQQGHYDVVHRVDGVDVPVPGSAQAFQQAEIEAFAGDDDWFVFWGHNSPHWPFVGDPERPFMGSTIPVRPRPSQDGINWPSWINDLPPYIDWSLEHSNARLQAAELHEVDRRLKAIWNHLEAEGLADDTTVIVTSDNGRNSGGHRLAGGGSKNTPYEESTVVPIVAWGPTVPMQQAIKCPTSIVDIPATVLAIAGATAPHPLDGDDLRDIARHPGDYEDRAAVVQITNLGTDSPVPLSDTICVTGWKLIRNREGGSITPGPGEIFELYDLANDPGELVNLASDPAYSAIVDDLDTRLDSLLPRWTDDFDRPDSTHIGNGWTNGHDTHPTLFDPIGVKDGAAYCPDPLARVPVEDYEPEDEVGHPPAEGRAYAAIGYTARETPEWWLPDIEVIRYGMNWANPHPHGGNGPPWDTRHIEMTPLLHIDPENPKGGFGVWPSVWEQGESTFGWFIVALIGSPPELFSLPEAPVIGSGTFDAHSDRGEQSLRIKCTAPGKAIIIHNDQQVSIGGYGMNPVDIPADLLHSRMMGFAYDAHFVRPYSKIPNYPLCARITFHGLGSEDLEL